MAVMKFLLILVVSLNFWEKFERETIGNCLASETLSETCRNYRKMMDDDRGGDNTNIVITSSLHLIKILYES